MQHILSLRLSFMIKETHFLSLPFSIIGMPYQDRKMSTRSFMQQSSLIACKNNFLLKEVSEINNHSFDKNAEIKM